MAPRPVAVLLTLLVLVTPASGCLEWLFGDDVGPVAGPPAAQIRLDLTVDGRLGVTVDFRENVTGGARWALSRGPELLGGSPLQREADGTFSGVASVSLGAGVHTLRVSVDGLHHGERDFYLAQPPWAPAGVGEWAFSSARTESGNASAELDGVIVSDGATWRLTATGVLHDPSGDDLVSGRVTEFVEERQGGVLKAARLAFELDLRTEDGDDLGHVEVVREFLGTDLRRDFTGATVEVNLYRFWTQTSGVRPTANGTSEVDESMVLHQWVDRRTGQPVAWEAWTWDNSTGDRRHDDGFGEGHSVPDLLRPWHGRMPQAVRAGDAFTFQAVGGARLDFTAASGDGGVVATGVANGTASGSATLRVDRDGRLVSYEESVTTGVATTTVQVTRRT